MALRQRTWAILIRPYFLNKNNVKVHYDGVPKVGAVSEMGGVGNNTARDTKGVNEGMEEWNTVPIDTGGWVMWYATTSYNRLREKYKECLIEHAQEHTRIVEVMPVDTMVTPIS